MAGIRKRHAGDDIAEDGSEAAEQVAEVASELAAEQASGVGETAELPKLAAAQTVEDTGEAEAETEVRTAGPLPIPPLLTDTEPAEGGSRDRVADAAAALRDKAADRAGIAREHAAEQAGAVRDKAAEHAGAVREKAVEHAAAAREKLGESAGEARERLAEGAAEAKVRGARMRKRFAEGAADARDTASRAAAEARDRVASTDVNELAHSTTRLIDQARPFFLAGFAVVFAILGFLEGDSGTAQLFVGGAILFVIGAGFSSEINAFIAHRTHHHEDHRAQQPGDRHARGGDPREHESPRERDER